MDDDNKEDDLTLSLTVALNKEGNKVLYALADSHFVDILLSFLTLPLGRIVKVLQKRYGDKAPTIGSLNSLYNGIANLDASHFVTEAAKKTLLDSGSPFDSENESLKLDISDSPPPEYFFCSKCTSNRFRNVSVYYYRMDCCISCWRTMSKEVVPKSSTAASVVDVYTKHKTSFIISDGLHILPSETGFQRIIGILGIADTDYGKSIKVDLGFTEIVKLLKASLTSPTPLSDVILSRRRLLTKSAFLENQPSLSEITISRTFILKVMIQNSTGKVLHAFAKKDFIEFLFSLLYIPLGEVEYLMAGQTCFKAIDNLYFSTSELIDDEYFSTRQAASRTTKCRLMKPNVVHGCTSNDHILRLNQEPLPDKYYYYATYSSNRKCLASSVRFPNGLGAYLGEGRTYKVTDDLTISPYCFVSILSSLREQKVLLSDIKEVEAKIGFKEALSILKASLVSTSALTDALLNDMPNKQVKREV